MSLGLQFYISIAVSLIVGLGASVVPNENIRKMMVIASTIGVLIAVGSTVYWFLNLLVLAVIMYFYLSSETIDDTLLKTMILISTISLLGWWRYEHKEGFYVSPLTLISNSLTAKSCQDMCQGTIGCKYSQVPVNTSGTGVKTKCWNSSGFNQQHWGNKNQGGDTWFNLKYKPPITITGSSLDGWYNKTISTSGSRAQTITISNKEEGINFIPKEITLSAKLRDQGWGNPTWGIYLEGYGPKGRVFKEVLKAARSSRTVSYPVYKNHCYYSWSKSWYSYRYWWWGWRTGRTYWWKPTRRCSKYIAYYGSKSVLGDPLNRSITKKINSNNLKVTSIKCYAHTRGSGHSLYASKVDWTVKGWKDK